MGYHPFGLDRRSARYAGAVCTGAFILAASRLLDGCEATTYWSQRENLALFPRIKVAGCPRWVISDNRFTGGGASSSIELALELVNLLAGPTECQQGQLRRSTFPVRRCTAATPARNAGGVRHEALHARRSAREHALLREIEGRPRVPGSRCRSGDRGHEAIGGVGAERPHYLSRGGRVTAIMAP
ncbi:MAG TPA: DJ-1/PfpI family protein [Thermoanaerobaculia bacterium]